MAWARASATATRRIRAGQVERLLRSRAVTAKAFETQIASSVPNAAWDAAAAAKNASGNTTMSQRGGAVILKRPNSIDKPAWDTARKMLLTLSGFAKLSFKSSVPQHPNASPTYGRVYGEMFYHAQGGFQSRIHSLPGVARNRQTPCNGLKLLIKNCQESLFRCDNSSKTRRSRALSARPGPWRIANASHLRYWPPSGASRH